MLNVVRLSILSDLKEAGVIGVWGSNPSLDAI